MLNCSCHTSTSGWRSSSILRSNSEPLDNKACLRSKMSRFNLLRFCCSLSTSGKALELFVSNATQRHATMHVIFVGVLNFCVPQSSPIWVPQAAWCIFTIFSLDSYFVHITIGYNTKSSQEDNHRWSTHRFKLYIQQKLSSWSFLLSVWWGKVCILQSPKY